MASPRNKASLSAALTEAGAATAGSEPAADSMAESFKDGMGEGSKGGIGRPWSDSEIDMSDIEVDEHAIHIVNNKADERVYSCTYHGETESHYPHPSRPGPHLPLRGGPSSVSIIGSMPGGGTGGPENHSNQRMEGVINGRWTWTDLDASPKKGHAASPLSPVLLLARIFSHVSRGSEGGTARCSICTTAYRQSGY